MVEKTEGAEMTCKNCNADLVCKMSNYQGSFENKLQWQNEDGTAYYKFNGHEYACVPMNQIEKPNLQRSQKQITGNKCRTSEERIADCQKFITFLADLQLKPTSSDLARVFSY